MNNSVNTFNKACASIRVKYQYNLDKSLGQNMLALSESEGYYERRGKSRWAKRASTWANSKDCVFLVMEVDEFGTCSKVEQVVDTKYKQDIVHQIETKEFMSNQQIFLLLGLLKTGSVGREREASEDIQLNIFRL